MRLRLVGDTRHPIACRSRILAQIRGQAVPVCTWVRDSAGGYSCTLCGGWVAPDMHRARSIAAALGDASPMRDDSHA